MGNVSRRTALLGAAAIPLALRAGNANAAEFPSIPNDFNWGVVAGGFQCEGSFPDSNWTRYIARRPPWVHDNYGNATDFLHRYRDDIALARDLGVNTVRFDIEWARVQPTPGEFSAEGLAFYDNVVHAVTNGGITPFITLHHFVNPGWVTDQHSWANPGTVTDYLRYVRAVVQRYSGLGITWMPVYIPVGNLQLEPQNGTFAPTEIGPATENLVQAQRGAAGVVHELDPSGRVTCSISFAPGISPIADAPLLDRIADTVDVLGLNYYYGASVSNPTMLNAIFFNYADITPEPEDMYWALRYYHDRFPTLPIYVVEGGMPTRDGQPRTDGYTRSNYLRDHTYWLQRALADGMPVVGYNYWSLTDAYQIESGGYTNRFGLYTVDALTDPTLTRRPTPAVDTYREIIRNGGVPTDYRPVAPPALCSQSDLPLSCVQPLPR